AGVVEVFEQDLIEAEPDAGLLPGVQAAPAGHATAATHLHGEVFPGDAGLEDEEDAGQRLAVADPFAAGVAKAARLGGWQQRFEEGPQCIRDERLGHDITSLGRQISPGAQRCESYANSPLFVSAS